jgi:PAS domain S-box-containing protein
VFRLLVSRIKDYAIFLLDPTGHIQTWNEGAERTKGYTAAEIIGRHFSVFYPPEEVRHGKPEHGLKVAASEGRWEDEGWRVRKDGSTFWADVVITALRDAAGELVGFAKVTRDLTERKRAEEDRERLVEQERQARQASEMALERLRAIQTVTEAALAHLSLDDLLEELLVRLSEALAADTVAVLLLTEDGAALTPRAAKGIEEEVAAGIRIPVGKGFAGRIAAERRPIALEDVEHAHVLNPILRQKGIRSLLGVPLLVEGRVIGIAHVGSLQPRHFDEEDAGFLQVVADRVALAIDRAREYEAARAARRAAEEAGTALRQREEFLALAAHELKTPVTSVQGLAEWLVRAAERGHEIEPARHRHALTMIYRQARNLTRLMNRLLDMTRLDAGPLHLELDVADLTPLVRQVVEQAAAQTDRHELILTGPEALLATVDAFRIEQVVTNLVNNAVKYSPEGGLVAIELAEPRPGIVRIAVRDQGIGVPPEDRERIFERFYQAHQTGHHSGLGLGLYLSRAIVERHGGRLWVESQADGGSCFVAEMPAAVTTASAG